MAGKSEFRRALHHCHCTTRELRDEAIHWARASAFMRWFYFDGIHLHYELDYALA